jgi:hypothetical protein
LSSTDYWDKSELTLSGKDAIILKSNIQRLSNRRRAKQKQQHSTPTDEAYKPQKSKSLNDAGAVDQEDNGAEVVGLDSVIDDDDKVVGDFSGWGSVFWIEREDILDTGISSRTLQRGDVDDDSSSPVSESPITPIDIETDDLHAAHRKLGEWSATSIGMWLMKCAWQNCQWHHLPYLISNAAYISYPIHHNSTQPRTILLDQSYTQLESPPPWLESLRLSLCCWYASLYSP